MMNHHEDFLAELDRLEYNPVLPNRPALIDKMKQKLDTLFLSLNYRKLKLRSIIDDDFVRDDGQLFEFFGSDDIHEQEKKLDELIKRLEKARYLQ